MTEFNQLTEQEAKQLVLALCAKATNWPIAIEPLQGPEPGNQYLTIRLVSIESQQHDIDEYIDGENDEKEQIQKGESRLHFRIMARGKDSYDALLGVRRSLRLPQRNFADDSTLPIPERFKNVPLYKYFGLSGIDDIQIITVTELGKVWNGAFMNVFFYANLKSTFDNDSGSVGTFKTIDFIAKTANTEYSVTVTDPHE